MLNFIQEHLPAVVGIVIALLIISVGFVMWGKMSTTLDEAGGQLDSMTSKISNEAFAGYDGRTDISGSAVITFVSDHANDPKFITIDGTNLSEICINTGATAAAAATDADYAKGTNKCTNASGSMTSPSANAIVSAMKQSGNAGKCYINPSWTFTGTCKYNTDGTIAGINFHRN